MRGAKNTHLETMTIGQDSLISVFWTGWDFPPTIQASRALRV